MTTLYDQIGGAPAMEAAVDLFYQKVLADDALAPFFATTDMVHQKKQQRDFLTMALGGPNQYDGRDMRAAHAHLPIEEAHFQAVAGHLQATLEELNVPADLIGQIMAIAASTHDDVLNL